MFELKLMSREAIPEALAKVERYRLLNEPVEAASICQDVLRIDPDNQQALVMLLLALTDQFDDGHFMKEARALIPRLRSEYERAYYSGIVSERLAKALQKKDVPGSRHIIYEFFREAMRGYERAEAIRPTGNDDAILRWNTCARILMSNPRLEPGTEERAEAVLSE
ncbi:MAG: hypothetical protein HY013_00430 [Candidatus Solibacter usitatus]|nr:hypothetical protein [Candidatus Solibacter usitatus]